MTVVTNKGTFTTSEGTGGHNNKPLNQFEITVVKLTAVEFLQEQYNQCPKYEERIYEQDWEKAKAMEKEQKIAFACKVAEVSAEKYIQGKTTEQIAKELLTA